VKTDKRITSFRKVGLRRTSSSSSWQKRKAMWEQDCNIQTAKHQL